MGPEEQTFVSAVWPDGAPFREIRCRHCRRKNSVAVDVACFEPERCVCGACGGRLFLGRDEPLVGLHPAAYQHSLDRSSLAALKALPGFGAAMTWLLKQTVDRVFRVQTLSSSVRCGPDQFPELVALMETASRRLALPFEVTLVLEQNPVGNAYTSGVADRVIGIWTGLLNILDEEALLAVIGHELGHQHAEHLVYKTLAILASAGTQAAGVVKLFTWPLRQGLAKWSRCAELTCDRAGLLASRKLLPALRVFLQFAGGLTINAQVRAKLQLPAFMAQARELDALGDASLLDGAVAMAQHIDQSHPFPVWRAHHLLKWVEHGNYLDIMAGDYRRVAMAA